MKINHLAQISISPDTTFGHVFDAVKDAQIPRDAQVTVDHQPGNSQRGEPAVSSLNFAWTTGSTAGA